MHLDTVVCPQVWRKVFSDGSVYEKYILIFMVVFWIFGVYACTSAFSVGEVQANVYFTAWICFFSTVMGYRTWRISAGKKTLSEMLVTERETARNWIGTCLATLIAALSVSDLYAFRNNLTFVIDGETHTIPKTEWYQILATVWTCFTVCCIMLLMIFCWTKPRFPFGPNGCRFDGRFIEGIVLLGLIGVYFWGILEVGCQFHSFLLSFIRPSHAHILSPCSIRKSMDLSMDRVTHTSRHGSPFSLPYSHLEHGSRRIALL